MDQKNLGRNPADRASDAINSVGAQPIAKEGTERTPTNSAEKQAEPDIAKVRKQFFVVLAAAGVLIVVLVVSIIVVAMNKNQNKAPSVVVEESASESSEETGNQEGYILTDEELSRVYSEEASNITAAVLAASENGEGFDGILQMYQEKINAAEDVRLKAMLEADYYLMRFSQTPTEEFKNEVLNALMRIDGVLKTVTSAYDVVTVATFYNEQEIVNYYTNLAIERNSAESNESETGDEEELETAP